MRRSGGELGGELTALREQLYTKYASTHAGAFDLDATEVFVRRALLPLLPVPSGDRPVKVVELGSGAGQVLRELQKMGFDATGVDASPEQVALADDGAVPGVSLGDAVSYLRELNVSPDAFLAIDFLEHLTKSEILSLLGLLKGRLAPGGRLIARLPNAASPFFGGLQFGDLSHETAFTPRSIAQVLNLSGFDSVTILPANPIVHGVISATRATVWQLCAAIIRLVLIAETGFTRGHIVTQNMLVVAKT
jgi:SAM-dependent methyltransferase